MGATWDKQQGLTDHTIDTESGIVAGLMLRSGGTTLGYLWCSGQVWQWRSADGQHFGERQTKKAAVETLHDIRDLATGQVRANRPALPPPAERIIHARPTIFTRETEPAPKRQVVWGDDETDAASLTAAIGAALNKHKGGSQ